MRLNDRPIYQKGQRPAKSAPIREAARGAPCALAIPLVCNRNPETTVFAHLRMFGIAGAGQKPDDLIGFDACHACHAHQERFADGPDSLIDSRDILRALVHSQLRRRASGLIILKGETP